MFLHWVGFKKVKIALLTESSKAHCGSKSWTIGAQKVQKEALFNRLQILFWLFSRIFCLTWTVGRQIFVHFVRMEQGRCFCLFFVTYCTYYLTEWNSSIADFFTICRSYCVFKMQHFIEVSIYKSSVRWLLCHPVIIILMRNFQAHKKDIRFIKALSMKAFVIDFFAFDAI